MLRDKAYRIGWIAKTHGVSGQLSVVTVMKISEPDEWPEWLFLEIDSGLVPFRSDPNGMMWRDEKHLVIALKDINNHDLAIKYVGNSIWFPKEFDIDIVAWSCRQTRQPLLINMCGRFQHIDP